jgi:hypothetical protein
MAITNSQFQFRGEDRARFQKVRKALLSLGARNDKVPLLQILTEQEATNAVALTVKMGVLLAQKTVR